MSWCTCWKCQAYSPVLAFSATTEAQNAHVGLPAVVSFTVETDGRLPTGQNLAEAVAEVDAATGSAPAYYMINCAHRLTLRV